MFQLSGRTALITGASGGIGSAIAKNLSQQGAHVILHGTRAGRLEELASEIGTNVSVVTANLSDREAVGGLVSEAAKATGAIDILVNNAGITRDKPLHKMEKSHWDHVIATNLDSLFNLSRAVIDGMRERGFGRIVNISSINGQKGQFGQTNYAAAKAGLIGFTKALALETASKGITVNAVAPGYIGTEMVMAVPEKVLNEVIIPQIPVGRLGEATEIARCVTFLASDDAGFITGSTLSANGGQYMA